MKKFTRHFLSMTTAAMLSGSAVLNCGLISALAAEYETEKLVPVIISLSGDAVLAGEEAAKLGTDYLDTAEAEEQSAALRQISSEAEASLRSLYPDLEIDYRYDALINGFSCKLPEDLLDEAESCRWVERITKVETVNVLKPELYTAPDLAEAGYFGETTGYFGEGEVIAVIDSELDISHSMFAPIDDKENKLTKDDIIAVAGDLNVQIDPEKAYVSSKLPYVIDYSDDTPYDYAAPTDYHGTHVSGIAAGNMISDDEGTELSGIARDAQLVMMKVFEQITIDETSGYYMSMLNSDTLIAAMEDAAKLKADVINLSLGSPEPDLDSIPYKDTITALNNAGIMVVAAAGNDSNNLMGGGAYFDIETSSPDTHTIGEPSAFRDAFCVASANNSFRRDPCFLIEGLDDEIPFCDGNNGSMNEMLGDDVYEYVYCGLGMPEDLEGKELEGKIALVDRGTLSFQEKAMFAEGAGAIAMIVCDDIEEDSLLTMGLDGIALPSAFISLNDGNKMKEAESGRIRLDSTLSVVTPLDGGISEFSSYGPAGDLTIKPDIAGIGGSVTSAAYDNKLMQLDGTSMASPYVAGCIAVFDQYLRENGMELKGAEKTAFIKNLMMNSAVLFSNDDVYESPRRQGAGLVNLKNALNDRVILTGESGLAKVELKDKITDQLSFDIDINNFTDEDVEFTEAKLVLTAEDGTLTGEDGSEQMSISGASTIGVTADLSALLTANAQESRTVTINAQLSTDDLEAHSSVFPNGFFVEGYIVLSGAENCCDISIPVMGFYGDWAKVPIFHNGTKYLDPYVLYTISGEGTLDASSSFAGTAEALAQLFGRLSPEDAELVMMDPFSINNFFDDEYTEALANCADEGVYISPNGDGLSEQIGLIYSLLRSAHITGIKIYDSDNNLISETPEDEMAEIAYMPMMNISEAEIKDYPEGTYKGVLEAYIYYEGAENAPQTYDFPVVLDKTSPSLEITPKEENGRKLLEITSGDKNLDGIYIMGKGSGGVAGEYTAESPQLTEISNYNSVSNAIYVPISGYNNPIRTDSLVINSIMGSADTYEQNIIDSYDFSDILPAYRYQNKDGSISVTYDITDLDEYVVAAVDKAFNATEIMSDGRDISHLKSGLWWAKNGGESDIYYNLSNNSTGSIRYQSGAPEKSFSLEQSGDTVTMEIFDGTSSEARTGKIAFTDKRNAEIVWDDGVTEKLFYASPDGFDGFNYITTPEMEEIVTAYHNAHSDSKAASAETAYDENGMGIVRLMDKNGSMIAEYTDFDRFKNIAVAPDGNTIEFEYIRNGVYRVTFDPTSTPKHYYVIFREDGTAVVYSAEDGIEWEGTAEYGDSVITCNKGTDDEMTVSVAYDSFAEFSVTLDDGSKYDLAYDSDHNEDVKVYTTAQLEEMASDYCERISGRRPAIMFASFDMNDKYSIYFFDGQSISADPLGGKAFDQFNNEIDLTVLPEIKDLFTPGLWSCRNGDSLTYYSTDGSGNITVTNTEDGSEENMKYNWIGTQAVELISGDNTETATVTPISDTELSLMISFDKIETLTYLGEKSIEKNSFYSDKKLADMAAADHCKKVSKKVMVSATESSNDGTVVIRFDDGSEYTIDRFTGKGTDENGNAVNLPQTGNNDISTAATAAAAGVLMILGTAAVLASRIFRRKEDC